MKLLIIGFLALSFVQIDSQHCDYYWRDYNGIVPEDAVPAGEDVNGEDTYIAQVYVQGHGLFVGQIHPPNQEVDVACYGPKKKDYAIKILCSGSRDSFSWLSTTWTSFHVDTIGKHAVVGGYDHVGNRGIIHIGRAMHQGILKIGHVASYQVGNVHFFFVHKNRMQKVNTFQVLICEKKKRNLQIDARTIFE